MPSETSEAPAHTPFEVVVVPFPFSDIPRAKRRPALVLSDRDHFNAPAGHTVLAMITTAKTLHWPLDVALKHPRAAGLPHNCFVRMKLFTLDNRLILKCVGQLQESDRAQVHAALRRLIVH